MIFENFFHDQQGWNNCIVVSFIIFIVWQCFKKYQQWNYLIEYKKRRVPYIGIVSPFWLFWKRKRREAEIDEVFQKHPSRVFGFDISDQSVTIVVGQYEIIKQVLSTEFTNFINRRNFPFKDKVLSHILLFTENEQWKRLRSIVTPTFTSGKMRLMKPLIDETLKTLLRNFDSAIQENEILDIKRLVGAFTMDTIVKTAFGVQINSLNQRNNAFVENAVKIFNREFKLHEVILFVAVLKFPFLGRFFRFNRSPFEFFKESSCKIIEQKRRDYFNRIKDTNNKKKALDFVELMLEAETSGEFETVVDGNDKKKENSKYITRDEMVAQCVFFFMAGYDTTATTITMCCYNLALNPETQEKLYDEITVNLESFSKNQEHQPDPIESVTIDLLSKFKYLNAVVDETLRLFSPVPQVERRANTQMTFETDDGKVKFEVHKGDMITIPIFSIHHDPKQWPEPYAFKPERFLDNPTYHKYAYLPFGLGPRNCVAKNLGLLEVKLAVLQIVRCYHLSVCNRTTIPAQFYQSNNILSPKSIYLKVEKRSAS